jgi:hypothetical protein
MADSSVITGLYVVVDRRTSDSDPDNQECTKLNSGLDVCGLLSIALDWRYLTITEPGLSQTAASATLHDHDGLVGFGPDLPALDIVSAAKGFGCAVEARTRDDRTLKR